MTNRVITRGYIALGFVLAGALALAAAEFTGDQDKDRARVLSRKNWWSFQAVQRPTPPTLTDPWIRTPIDAFLLEAMQGKNLSPSVPATKSQLIRRVTLDLTGLPPTPNDVAAFLADKRVDAYERVVDRLLASPQYGERWALRWLDVVRYADTNGYELDAERTHAWRYRDYVIRSFNEDKPFNQFLKEQVAADEIWPEDKSRLVALGFHRAGPEHLVGGNQDAEMNRQEVLVEMTAGISNVFLGLTMNCARCHNHKFDPILQSDYYRLQAVFANTQGKDIEIASAEEKARFEKEQKAWKARLKPVSDAIEDIEKPYRERLLEQNKQLKLDDHQRALLSQPKDKLSETDRQMQTDAREQIKPAWDEVLAQLSEGDRQKRTELRRQLHELELDEPEAPATIYGVVNSDKPAETNVLKVGDHRMKLGTVTPGVPFVLASTSRQTLPEQELIGRRKALAEWLADPEHPLTARVMVNRIWQFRMGRGIVATPNDFGMLGERPTNVKLLDWLASEFVARRWSVKAIDRLICTSSVYRQASVINPAKKAIDDANRFWWRMNRKRLEGETIRDSVLAVTGLLNPKMGGRPVKTPLEPEVYNLIFTESEPDNLWPLARDRSEVYRRSIYLVNKRTVRLPLMANFDQPDAMTSCAARSVSTHALQALTLMNSAFMTEQSTALATRMVKEAGRSQAAQVRHAYQLTLARDPSVAELKLARDFFRKQGSLSDFCLALLNRSEFVYVQ